MKKTLKVKILNEYGVALNLSAVDFIKFKFLYENGEILEKKNATILDIEQGLVAIELSDFEIQGLKVGTKQTFFAEILAGDKTMYVKFNQGFDVALQNEKKVIL